MRQRTGFWAALLPAMGLGVGLVSNAHGQSRGQAPSSAASKVNNAARPAAGATQKLPRFEHAAFTANASQLRAEAKEVLASQAAFRDAHTMILLAHSDVAYETDGRVRNVYREIFVLNSQTGVDDWGALSWRYMPFYQQPTKIRARVIGKDGKVTEIDQKLVTDQPAIESDSKVFSDARTVRVPLPRLEVGAVVECQFETVDKLPLLQAGTIESFGLGGDTPTYLRRVTIKAPSTLTLQVTKRGPMDDIKPSVSKVGGQTITSFERWNDITPIEYEADAPNTVAQYPSVVIGTGASWQAVAKGYHQLIAANVSGAVTVPPSLRGANEFATATNIVRWLHKTVRYTGIEFGDAALIPWRPADTLARGFGDCKDKASLAIAVLRSFGISADLALLRTGPGLDVSPDAVGLGMFDHAIIVAKLDGKQVWIDATEDMLPLGVLPERDQGRKALVINDATKSLVETPVSNAEETVTAQVRTYAVNGEKTTVREITTQSGVSFDSERRWYARNTKAEIEEALRGIGESHYDGKLVSYTAASPDDVTIPFAPAVDYRDTTQVVVEREKIELKLYPATALWSLPRALQNEDKDLDEEAETRKLSFVFSHLHKRVVENRFAVPDGFALPKLQPRSELRLGALTIVITRKLTGRNLAITFELTVPKRELTADEFRSTRKAIMKLYTSDQLERVVFAEQSADALSANKFVEAIAFARQRIKLAPNDYLSYYRLANVYFGAMLGDKAIAVSKRIIEVAPKDGDAWSLRGWALGHNSVGHWRGYGYDRKGAIAAYEKALTLIPTHAGAMRSLAEILSKTDNGFRNAVPSELKRALVLYQKLLAVGESVERELIDVALRVGDLNAAEEAAEKIQDAELKAIGLARVELLRNGAKSALERIDAANLGNKRDVAIGSTFTMSLYMGRFELARELLNLAPTINFNRKALDQMPQRKVKDLPWSDPVKLGIGSVTGARLIAGVSLPYWDSKQQAEVMFRHQFRAPDSLEEFDEASFLSLSQMLSKYTVDGDAKVGFRVDVDGPVPYSVYVIVKSGQPLLLGSSIEPAGVYLYMLERIAAGDMASARRFANWRALDFKLDPKPRDAKWWLTHVKDGAADDESVAFLAAMGAALSYQATAQSVKIFAACKPANARSICDDLGPGAARHIHDFPQAVELARSALTRSHAVPKSLARIAILGLAEQGKHDEVVKELAALEAKSGKEPWFVELKELVTLRISATPAEVAATLAQAEKGTASVQSLNQIVWSRLWFDKDTKEAQRISAKLEEFGNKLPNNAHNTLAVLAAELGRSDQLWQHFVASRKGRESLPYSDADWYVVGRLWELMGENADAKRAYEQVGSAKGSIPDSTHFAQRRLATMKK